MYDEWDNTVRNLADKSDEYSRDLDTNFRSGMEYPHYDEHFDKGGKWKAGVEISRDNDDKGKPIGAMNYTVYKGQFLYVNFLETSPEARYGRGKYKGVGTTLLARAVELSKKHGAGGAIKLAPTEDAKPFYKKLGMTYEGGYFHFSAEQANDFLASQRKNAIEKSLGLSYDELVDLEDRYGVGVARPDYKKDGKRG